MGKYSKSIFDSAALPSFYALLIGFAIFAYTTAASSNVVERMANSRVRFRIYNPSYKEWLYVSTDILRGDNMVESHPYELDERNEFILEKHNRSGIYRIYNPAYKMYLFVSNDQKKGDHVVEAHGVQNINEDRNGFRFFSVDTGGGTFKIYNPYYEEYLFVSNDTEEQDHVVESHPRRHENEERNKFQLQIISDTSIIIAAGLSGTVNLRLDEDVKTMIDFANSKQFFIWEVLTNNNACLPRQNIPNAWRYNDLMEFRRHLTDFYHTASTRNLIFYFTGHGGQITSHGLNSEALVVANGTYYFDTEFTQDLLTSMGKTLYVVLDACHAEGLINLWELQSDMRLNLKIIIFSASHSEISTYPRIFTPAFVRKAEIGKPVYIIADEILQEINESKIPNQVFRDVSPGISASRPALLGFNFCK